MLHKNNLIIYLILFPTLFIFTSIAAFAQNNIRTVEPKNYTDVLALFDEIGYTAEQWQAGIREIPRLEITHIPKRWQEQSPHIPVKDKKNIFFRLAGPGILLANEKIAADRKQLLDKINNNRTKDDPWVLQLAKRYKVIGENRNTINIKDLDTLKHRVDIIPPSLSLAQAAEESGWGTSRFAVQGNALFGQWDFSGQGIKPKNQRKELGNYGIAKFDTPQAAIEAYILNLNTHNAYKKLRNKRATIREKGIRPTGWELANTLDQYSERGAAYVETLHSIMEYNKLKPVDDAYLWDKGRIIVSPAP